MDHATSVATTPTNSRFRQSSAKPPRRVCNRERRSREFLTPAEVDKLMAAAERQGRHGHGDATMVLMAYRHGLRVSELVSLRWDQVDFAQEDRLQVLFACPAIVASISEYSHFMREAINGMVVESTR